MCPQVAAGIPDGCEEVGGEGGSRVNKGHVYDNSCERDKQSWTEGGRRKTAFEDRQGGARGRERLAEFCNGATLGGGGQWASC